MTDRQLLEQIAQAASGELLALQKKARRKIRKTPDRLEVLLDRVCRGRKLPVSEVISKKRDLNLVLARQEFAKKARMLHPGPPPTYKEIGEKLGGRDHATIKNYFK